MNPVICFYKNQWLWSENYSHLEKPSHLSTENFLLKIEKDYFNEIKIIQVDFDAFNLTNKNYSTNKIKYYKSPGAQVYIINEHELLDPEQALLKISEVVAELPKFNILTTSDQFYKNVRDIVQEINLGRFYQVNLTAAFSAFTNSNSLGLFKNYVSSFEPTYPTYLPGDNFSILSFSPELFLQKQESQLISRPIKGTSAKGYTDLINNPKEAAELSMIVDLIRNDLNSVSTGPAKVTAHRAQLQLPYTTHTFSEIEVTTDQTLPQILKKTMPGGSISGCPKIESLKAISEYENYDRQFYTGTIGWWQRNDFELSIAIRSFVATNENLFYFAGCGIVAESDPEAEWNELLNKASKLKLNHTK